MEFNCCQSLQNLKSILDASQRQRIETAGSLQVEKKHKNASAFLNGQFLLRIFVLVKAKHKRHGILSEGGW